MNTEKYQQLYKDFQILSEKIKKIQSILQNVFFQIDRDPEKLIFSDVGNLLPEQSSLPITANGKEWPTAQEIQDLVRNYFIAKRNLEIEWGNLDSASRSALRPPPSRC